MYSHRIDGVPISQIRGIRAKMQEFPSRPVLRNHLFQPCVFAFNMVGANATDNLTSKATIGYKMYAMCHIVIFGRPRGAARISKPELRRRAAAIAAGGLHSAAHVVRDGDCMRRRARLLRGRQGGAARRRPRRRRH